MLDTEGQCVRRGPTWEHARSNLSCRRGAARAKFDDREEDATVEALSTSVGLVLCEMSRFGHRN